MMQDEEHTDRVTRLDIEAAESLDQENRASSAAPFTPTTDQVRDLYELGALSVNEMQALDLQGAMSMFDRWLAGIEAATKPRTVTTAAERDALPVGAIIMTASGRISCRFDAIRATVFGDERAYPWADLTLPATIIFTPTDPVSNR